MISFVVPTLNEVGNIEKTIDKITQNFSKNNNFEIIFVDDKSNDGTLDKIKSISKYNSNIRLIISDERFGLGHALIQGQEKAIGEYIFFLDCDNSINYDDLNRLIKARDQNSLIIGSRYIKYSKINGVNKIKIFLSRILNFIISKYLNINAIDISHSCRLFPKNIFVIPGIIIALFLTKKVLIPLDYLFIIINILSICLIASANYLINEHLDSTFDKFHPIKKNRPSVKSPIRLSTVIIVYSFLIITSLIISINSNTNFIISLVIFAILGVLYNVRPVRFKDRPYLDILSESLNNPVRLILGWTIIEPIYLPPASIILCFWMGGAFLMTIKRFAELRYVKRKTLIKYRITFKYYSENKLLLKSFFYSLMACFFLGIFLVKYRIESHITWRYFGDNS